MPLQSTIRLAEFLGLTATWGSPSAKAGSFEMLVAVTRGAGRGAKDVRPQPPPESSRGLTPVLRVPRPGEGGAQFLDGFVDLLYSILVLLHQS